MDRARLAVAARCMLSWESSISGSLPRSRSSRHNSRHNSRGTSNQLSEQLHTKAERTRSTGLARTEQPERWPEQPERRPEQPERVTLKRTRMPSHAHRPTCPRQMQRESALTLRPASSEFGISLASGSGRLITLLVFMHPGCTFEEYQYSIIMYYHYTYIFIYMNMYSYCQL